MSEPTGFVLGEPRPSGFVLGPPPTQGFVLGPPPVEEADFLESVLPRFIQEGYNRSIMGLADQIIAGEQRFDLSGYDPSTLEDIGATVASFLMPADFLLTVGTGGLASIPARALAKRTVAELVKAGVKGQVAKKVAQAGVTRAVQGASVLGVYSGAQSALGQQAEFGEIDPGEVTKATLRGTVTGAIAGGAGGAIAGRFAARADVAAKIAGSEVVGIRPLEKAVEIAGEVVAFGTAVPALEMRLPTAQDYTHAAGVIIGLRAVHATASTGMKALRKSIASEVKTEVEGEIIQPEVIVGADLAKRTNAELFYTVKRDTPDFSTFEEFLSMRLPKSVSQAMTELKRRGLSSEEIVSGLSKLRGVPIEEAVEIVGARRLTEVQAERATEAPDVPLEPLKPGIRPKPRIEPEIPPEVQSVTEVYAKQRADIKALNKADPKETYAELKRRWVDVRANVRQKILKDGGQEGHKAVVDFDTVAGAPGEAQRQYIDADKMIFRPLSSPEYTMLADIIQWKRSIELDRIFDERGEPRLDHPGGKGKESLEAKLEYERQQHPEMMKKLETAAAMYFAETRKPLDQLYEHGILNRESYEACKEYQHYSMRLYLQHLDPVKASYKPSGEKISVPDSGLKELDRGSQESMMNDPRILLSQTQARATGRIFRNEANKSLYRYTEANPDNGWLSIQEPKRITKAGVPEYGKAPPGKEAISVMLEGRQHRMLMDKELAREWLIRDPEISAQLSNFVRIISGGFILRPMATGMNPEFAVGNFFRDAAHIQLTTTEYSSFLPYGVAQFLKDVVGVAKDAATKKGRYVDYVKEGGSMEWLTHQGRPFKLEPETVKTGFFRDLRKTLEYVGETSEVLSRLALRDRAIRNRAKGGEVTPEITKDATWVARNYLDFAQGGSFTKAIDAGVPYFSAATQGTRGIIRAAHDNPGVFTYKVAQIGMLSVGLYLWNRDKNPEAWAQVQDRQKVSNWILTTPFYRIDENGRKRYRYISIPKDQGQRVFASMFEALMERGIEGKWPRKQVLASIADFLPLVPSEVLSPTLEAYFGYLTNKDFWYREDIWKGREVEAKEEYHAGTHPFFVKFGDVTGLSPVRMRYALGNIFTRRNIYSDVAGAGWEFLAGDLDDEQKAAALKDLKDVPFARRLYRETNPMYEDVEDLERLSIEENTRRHRQNRELSEIYALTEVEKEELRLAVSEQARKRIYQVRVSERNAEFREFIKQQPTVDRQRLINRRNAMQRHIGLSNWWYDLMELPPEPRAAAFYSRWYESDPETREDLIKTARRIGGIMSGRFMARFRRLAKEEMKQ